MRMIEHFRSPADFGVCWLDSALDLLRSNRKYSLHVEQKRRQAAALQSSATVGPKTFIFLLLIIFSLGADARTISWAGRFWTVKQSSTPVGPGPNLFSDSTNSVWVDGNGYLHLKLTESNGTWHAAEILSEQTLGYGEYRFLVEGRVDNYDTNVVAGLFTYDGTLPDGSTNEIDIEFTKAFSSLGGTNNALFSAHPAGPSDSLKFKLSLTNGALTTHLFDWGTNRTDFLSYHSHSTSPAPSDVIAEFNYTGPNIPVSPAAETVHFVLFPFQGNALVDTQNLELIVRDFQFTPASFLPGTQAQAEFSGTIGAMTANDFIDIVETNYSWGTVSRSPSRRRFKSLPLTVNYFVANGPWKILIYTEGKAKDGHYGLERLGGGTHQLDLRFNQPNLGIAGDPNVNWNTTWAPVLPEDVVAIMPNIPSFASSANQDPSEGPLTLLLGVDVYPISSYISKTNYTAKLVLELAYQ